MFQMNTPRITRAALLAFIATSGMIGQSVERLNPSQGAAATVGRGRPLEENIGAGIQSHIPYTEMERLSAGVKALSLDPVAVAEELAKFADRNPGHNYVNITKRTCEQPAYTFTADGSRFDCLKWAVASSETNTNLRTDVGDDWQSELMGKTTTPTVNTQCNYVALTNDSGSPAAGDTTLASEIASNGLTRAQGTYGHTAGSSTYTIAKTFTATGTQASQKTGLFTASSSGTMCFENTYTAVTVNNTDTLTVTWTINF
jgi:hypothetical protein